MLPVRTDYIGRHIGSLSVDESGKSIVSLDEKSGKTMSIGCCFPPKFDNSGILLPREVCTTLLTSVIPRRPWCCHITGVITTQSGVLSCFWLPPRMAATWTCHCQTGLTSHRFAVSQDCRHGVGCCEHCHEGWMNPSLHSTGRCRWAVGLCYDCEPREGALSVMGRPDRIIS